VYLSPIFLTVVLLLLVATDAVREFSKKITLVITTGNRCGCCSRFFPTVVVLLLVATDGAREFSKKNTLVLTTGNRRRRFFFPLSLESGRKLITLVTPTGNSRRCCCLFFTVVLLLLFATPKPFDIFRKKRHL
jgi:hypothetical protein